MPFTTERRGGLRIRAKSLKPVPSVSGESWDLGEFSDPQRSRQPTLYKGGGGSTPAPPQRRAPTGNRRVWAV